MVNVSSLRAGANFEENGNIFEVLNYEHIKMGRGSATVKIKARNLRSGSTIERSYISHAEVNGITLDRRQYQYLYRDEQNTFFMDPVSYEQSSIPLKNLDGYMYLKEGENVELKFYQDEPLSILLAPKVTLIVKDTPPGVKGDSASNMYKEATLENGIKTKVPLFVNIGDKIIVDTRDGSYTKRA